MRTALDIVRDLVREEQTLAQRLEVVRAQLGRLKQLAGVQTSARTRRPSSSGPTRPAASSAARPAGRKAARARRAPRRARPLAPPAPEERPVRTEVIARAARGKAIRELLEQARATAAAPAPAAPEPHTPRAYRPRRMEKLEGGEVFGCWTVLREVAPDVYGRARYWARASCCGHESTKGRGDLERGHEACNKCVDRTKRAVDLAAPPREPRRRGPNACGTCGQKGHKGTCRERSDASPWVRCKLTVAVTTGAANIHAQGYTCCGALVLTKKRAQHLEDVHGLEVAVGDIGQHFDLVDPRQGAEK